jgi:hypothetical protein
MKRETASTRWGAVAPSLAISRAWAVAVLSGHGRHARDVRELLHLLHQAGHQLAEIGRDVLEDDDDGSDR